MKLKGGDQADPVPRDSVFDMFVALGAWGLVAKKLAGMSTKPTELLSEVI